MSKNTDHGYAELVDKLNDIHTELRRMHSDLDDFHEARKSEKTEFSFLVSILAICIALSSVLVKALSEDRTVAVLGGGVSFLILVMVACFMHKLKRERPLPREILVVLFILLLASIYCITVGIGLL